MATATTVPPAARERVFCHECRSEWYRDQGGLVCPNETCRSDFVEIIENNNDPRQMPDLMDFDDSDDEDDHYRHRHFPPFAMLPPMGARSRSPGGTTVIRAEGPGFSYVTTRTTFNASRGGSGTSSADGEVIADLFTTMLRNIMGDGWERAAGAPGGAEQGQGDAREGGDGQPHSPPPSYGSGARLNPRNADAPQAGDVPNPQDITSFLASLFGAPGTDDPAFARLFGVPPGAGGDYVYSQAELDRIISQLMEQHSGNAPPPAAQEDIDALPRVMVTEAMVYDGVDCAVCKDDLVLNEQVAQLPCKHTYHFECVSRWLEAHDTCPICRHPITPEGRRRERRSCSYPITPEGQRRERRSSSSASGPGQPALSFSTTFSGTPGFPFLGLFGGPTRPPQPTSSNLPTTNQDSNQQPATASSNPTHDEIRDRTACPPGSFPTEDDEEPVPRYSREQNHDAGDNGPRHHHDSGSGQGRSAFSNIFRRRAS
ncbi:hypothetical protein FN846DRAFT_341734 [Sphaerosporella brunnea]|uniref:RING-type E3 ubiquitin transferase n=1 Tax=Sphaerosporella brunnea TaxID=1250544 RepID=A0A5J5EJJ4_9PEZI|nr:hypothetical protein FN846DRAFT_341734 [Sphaerosporella brunnea]